MIAAEEARLVAAVELVWAATATGEQGAGSAAHRSIREDGGGGWNSELGS